MGIATGFVLGEVAGATPQWWGEIVLPQTQIIAGIAMGISGGIKAVTALSAAITTAFAKPKGPEDPPA